MLGLQVLPARRRGRPRPLLDVRAARLRGGRRATTLLCRAHAYSATSRSSCINYDEEILRSGVADRGRATAAVEAVEPLTHDIRAPRPAAARARDARRSSPASTSTSRSPAPTDEHRSFSMANTPASRTALEFMIKLYPGGHFSGLLADGPASRSATSSTLHRPLRRLHAARLLAAPARLHRRRRRHGADPVAAALDGREGQRRGRRPSTTARAPRPTCSHLDELERLAPSCPTCASSPRSRSDVGDGWGGEAGLITDVVDRLRGATSPRSTPTCAARRRWSTPRSRCSSAGACPESPHLLRQVHDHRGLTAARRGAPCPKTRTGHAERSVPKPVFTDAEAGAKEFPSSTQPQLQLLRAAQAARDASTRTSPSTSSPTPSAT